MSVLEIVPTTAEQFAQWTAAASGEIKRLSTEGTARQAATDKAIETSRKALEAIEAGKIAAAQVREVQGSEGDLVRRYGEADGSVRLTAANKTIQVKGAKGETRSATFTAPGLLDDPSLACEWQRAAQRAIGARAIARMVLRPGTPTPELDAEVLRTIQRAPMGMGDAILRSFVDVANAGAEWIPDVFSPELWMAFEVPTEIEDLFETVQISGGSTLRPKVTGQGRPYLIGAEADLDEPAKLPLTSITTDQQALTCPTFGMRFLIGYAAAEDSAILVQQVVSDLLVKSLRDGYEDCQINGDTAATHQDTGIAGWDIRSRWGTSGLGTSVDHRRAFIGFRAMATDRSCTVNQASGMTAAKIMEELMGGMGEYAASDLVIITSPEVYFKKLLTDTNLLTVDKAGPAATIIAGNARPVAFIGGRPVKISRFVDSKYNTSGIYDNSTKTKSGVIVADRAAFKHYQKRGPTTEITRKADTQRIELVCTRRKGMDTLTASTAKVSMWGYGWTGES